MAEKSDIIASLMNTPRFCNRVRAIAAIKAQAVLEEATPDADDLTWAKGAVGPNYDCWTEAMIILTETQPATVNAAMTATDTTYTSVFNTVFAAVVKAKV